MGVRNKRTLTKTRRYLRDLDQIKTDMLSPKHLKQHKEKKAPEDLPGLGRHYCIECAKFFETETSLIGHRRAKPHKRRVKQLKEEPYTQKTADGPLWTDNKGPQKAQKADIDMS